MIKNFTAMEDIYHQLKNLLVVIKIGTSLNLAYVVNVV